MTKKVLYFLTKNETTSLFSMHIGFYIPLRLRIAEHNAQSKSKELETTQVVTFYKFSF